MSGGEKVSCFFEEGSHYIWHLMNFDFHDKYKDYSNIDLLKIVRRPTEYQVAAVDAATQILSTREVTQSDFEMVEIFFNETNTETKRKTEKINSYKEKTADFFESVLNPTTEIKPEKWLNILLLVIGLQYLWTLYVNIVDLVKLIKYVIDCKSYGFENTMETVSYWTCFSNQFNPLIFFQILTLIYVPIIFYLLFKRKRLGWILLFADNLFGLISTVSQSYIFFKYQQYHHGNTLSFLTQILIKGLFMVFLWRNHISDFFNVTKKTKKKTAIITTIVTIIFIISIQLFVWQVTAYNIRFVQALLYVVSFSPHRSAFAIRFSYELYDFQIPQPTISMLKSLIHLTPNFTPTLYICNPKTRHVQTTKLYFR